jgi:hypothetical protein
VRKATALDTNLGLVEGALARDGQRLIANPNRLSDEPRSSRRHGADARTSWSNSRVHYASALSPLATGAVLTL